MWMESIHVNSGGKQMLKENSKNNNEQLVRCIDCINSNIQLYGCALEECFNQEVGYCTYCPCNKCDEDCLTPELSKTKVRRPKYVKGKTYKKIIE